MTLADGVILQAGAFRHLLQEAREDAGRAGVRPRAMAAAGDAVDPPFPSLEQLEKDYIMEVLQATRWNRKEASRILGISTVTLWRKINTMPGADSKG